MCHPDAALPYVCGSRIVMVGLFSFKFLNKMFSVFHVASYIVGFPKTPSESFPVIDSKISLPCIFGLSMLYMRETARISPCSSMGATSIWSPHTIRLYGSVSAEEDLELAYIYRAQSSVPSHHKDVICDFEDERLSILQECSGVASDLFALLFLLPWSNHHSSFRLCISGS